MEIWDGKSPRRSGVMYSIAGSQVSAKTPLYTALAHLSKTHVSVASGYIWLARASVLDDAFSPRILISRLSPIKKENGRFRDGALALGTILV